MESKTNYTLTGLFVVILGTVLVAIAFWLSSGLSKISYKTYTVYMNESVIGLNPNSSVKYNGVSVGYVSHLDLNPLDPKQVQLTLEIEDRVTVRQDMRATLTSQGITGLTFINLTGGSLKSPRLRRKDNEKYPVIIAEPSLLFRIDAALGELSTSLTGLSQEMRDVFDPENRAAFKKTLKNMDALSSTLAANAAQIDESIKHLNVTLKNTALSSAQMPGTLMTIKKMGAEANITIQSLNQSLPQILTQMNELMFELQRNPSVLVRGRAAPAPGPGE